MDADVNESNFYYLHHVVLRWERKVYLLREIFLDITTCNVKRIFLTQV